MASIEDGFSRHFKQSRSIRDEYQELVRLKKITQDEVDQLLGKVRGDRYRGINFIPCNTYRSKLDLAT